MFDMEKINEGFLIEKYNYTFENEAKQIKPYIGNNITFPNLKNNTIEILNRNILAIVENIYSICKNTNTKVINNDVQNETKMQTNIQLRSKTKSILENTEINCEKLLKIYNSLNEIMTPTNFLDLYKKTKQSIEKFLKIEINNMSKNIETPNNKKNTLRK